MLKTKVENFTHAHKRRKNQEANRKNNPTEHSRKGKNRVSAFRQNKMSRPSDSGNEEEFAYSSSGSEGEGTWEGERPTGKSVLNVFKGYHVPGKYKPSMDASIVQSIDQESNDDQDTEQSEDSTVSRSETNRLSVKNRISMFEAITEPSVVACMPDSMQQRHSVSEDCSIIGATMTPETNESGNKGSRPPVPPKPSKSLVVSESITPTLTEDTIETKATILSVDSDDEQPPKMVFKNDFTKSLFADAPPPDVVEQPLQSDIPMESFVILSKEDELFQSGIVSTTNTDEGTDVDKEFLGVKLESDVDMRDEANIQESVDRSKLNDSEFDEDITAVDFGSVQMTDDTVNVRTDDMDEKEAGSEKNSITEIISQVQSDKDGVNSEGVIQLTEKEVSVPPVADSKDEQVKSMETAELVSHVIDTTEEKTDNTEKEIELGEPPVSSVTPDPDETKQTSEMGTNELQTDPPDETKQTFESKENGMGTNELQRDPDEIKQTFERKENEMGINEMQTDPDEIKQTFESKENEMGSNELQTEIQDTGEAEESADSSDDDSFKDCNEGDDIEMFQSMQPLEPFEEKGDIDSDDNKVDDVSEETPKTNAATEFDEIFPSIEIIDSGTIIQPQQAFSSMSSSVDSSDMPWSIIPQTIDENIKEGKEGISSQSSGNFSILSKSDSDENIQIVENSQIVDNSQIVEETIAVPDQCPSMERSTPLSSEGVCFNQSLPVDDDEVKEMRPSHLKETKEVKPTGRFKETPKQEEIGTAAQKPPPVVRPTTFQGYIVKSGVTDISTYDGEQKNHLYCAFEDNQTPPPPPPPKSQAVLEELKSLASQRANTPTPDDTKPFPVEQVRVDQSEESETQADIMTTSVEYGSYSNYTYTQGYPPAAGYDANAYQGQYGMQAGQYDPQLFWQPYPGQQPFTPNAHYQAPSLPPEYYPYQYYPPYAQAYPNSQQFNSSNTSDQPHIPAQELEKVPTGQSNASVHAPEFVGEASKLTSDYKNAPSKQKGKESFKPKKSQSPRKTKDTSKQGQHRTPTETTSKPQAKHAHDSKQHQKHVPKRNPTKQAPKPEHRKSSAGGDVEGTPYETDDGNCTIVTFSDAEVVERVCAKKDHILNGQSLQVSPFYKCELGELYDAKLHKFSLPEPIVLTLSTRMLFEVAGELKSTLLPMRFIGDNAYPYLLPQPYHTKRKGIKEELGRGCAFSKHPDVVVLCDESKCLVEVFGLRASTSSVFEDIEGNVKQWERQLTRTTERITYSFLHLKLMEKLGFISRLKEKPEFDVRVGDDFVDLEGQPDDITHAKLELHKGKDKMKVFKYEHGLSFECAEFVGSKEKVIALIDESFKEKRIEASWKLEGSEFHVVFVKDQEDDYGYANVVDMDSDIVSVFSNILEKFILYERDDKDVFHSAEWTLFITDLTEDHDDFAGFDIDEKKCRLVMHGWHKNVNEMYKQDKETIEIRGNKKDRDMARDKLEKVFTSVIREEHTIEKVSVKDVFQDEKARGKIGEIEQSTSLSLKKTYMQRSELIKFPGQRQHQGDVFVVSTSPSLNLKGGQAGRAILHVAGHDLQHKIKEAYPEDIAYGDIADVGGGKMKCDCMYLTALPGWKAADHKAQEVLKKLVQDCLKKASKEKKMSIVFSALGCGQLKYPVEVVAGIMFESAVDFDKNNKKSSLKTAFKDELRLRRDGGGKRHVDVILCSTSSTMDLKHGACLALLKKGGKKLEEECASNYSNTLDDCQIAEISSGDLPCKKLFLTKLKEMLRTAFKLAETRKYSSLAIPAMGTGNLKYPKEDVCRCMFETFIELGKQEEANKHFTIFRRIRIFGVDLKVFIGDILEHKADAFVTSTGSKLELHGAGFSPIKPENIAESLFDALDEFMSDESTDLKIREVHLIVYKTQAERFQPIIDVLRSKAMKATSDLKSGSLGQLKKAGRKFWKKTKELVGVGYLASEEGATAQPRPSPSSSKRNTSTLALYIYSDSSENIQRCKQRLETHLEEALITAYVKQYTAIVCSLTKEEKEELESLPLVVDMKIDEKDGIVVIKGERKLAFEAQSNVREMLMRFEKNRCELEQSQELAKKIEWQYEEEDTIEMKYKFYGNLQSFKMEMAYQRNERFVSFVDNGVEYEIDFNDMVEYAKHDKADLVRVVRKEILKGQQVPLPTEWKAMKDGVNIKLVEIKPDEKQFKDIEARFMTEIERIQNKALYQQYQAKKSFLQEQKPILPPNMPLERELWHGTNEAAMDSIICHGFNRSYAGDNAGKPWYGQGVYFASDASYSARSWMTGAGVGKKGYVFLVKALTGHLCPGKPGMRVLEPVDKAKDPLVLYDCAVDKLANPMEFVIFSDTQAYPAYILTFSSG
ncbi:PAR14-like protein [Mya arenaria]|uniref:Poly [ADP-ribose] polymerase n=1 Tax=Mya arenaria TaxID=6604 RepID=A0ABY7FFJ5_MYAAR|nr:PAR14-like protein [Mya arenaria]